MTRAEIANFPAFIARPEMYRLTAAGIAIMKITRRR